MSVLTIRTITVTPFEQNARILCGDGSQGEASNAVLIDPGGEVKRILASLPENSQVNAIWLTHAHIDHAGGVAHLLRELQERTGTVPKLYGHSAETTLRRTLSQQALMFGLNPIEYSACPEPDIVVQPLDMLDAPNGQWEARFTPGHSPGHLSFYFASGEFVLENIGRSGKIESTQEHKGPLVIAGDALFQGSIGRTDLPGGNHEQLLASIRSQLFSLPEETLVLCGHGPNTTIGKEKRSNPFFR